MKKIKDTCSDCPSRKLIIYINAINAYMRQYYPEQISTNIEIHGLVISTIARQKKEIDQLNKTIKNMKGA